jgi:hypothetical protein
MLEAFKHTPVASGTALGVQVRVSTEPLQLLISNHFSLREEHKEKQEVALTLLLFVSFVSSWLE